MNESPQPPEVTDRTGLCDSARTSEGPLAATVPFRETGNREASSCSSSCRAWGPRDGKQPAQGHTGGRGLLQLWPEGPERKPEGVMGASRSECQGDRRDPATPLASARGKQQPQTSQGQLSQHQRQCCPGPADRDKMAWFRAPAVGLPVTARQRTCGPEDRAGHGAHSSRAATSTQCQAE